MSGQQHHTLFAQGRGGPEVLVQLQQSPRRGEKTDDRSRKQAEEEDRIRLDRSYTSARWRKGRNQRRRRRRRGGGGVARARGPGIVREENTRARRGKVKEEKSKRDEK
eukprot:758605-Hanusia_phi.AAC.2